jgi:hypothetical protein
MPHTASVAVMAAAARQTSCLVGKTVLRQSVRPRLPHDSDGVPRGALFWIKDARGLQSSQAITPLVNPLRPQHCRMRAYERNLVRGRH